ncbi:class I SAM-dependent methyltransferase [Gilvimarinus agarilyticus]|uniref:class I SAM-dependent methyltransferase n=1 Tax=Gilvimarinus agarilyticus TaxID=679259 RepID=UPI0005A0A434|nr:class I SAM-dependent methyltransferase [Gilvimarinus agarilyticus]
MVDHNERRILNTWQRNADSWTRAVRDGTIASRQQVTDQAVVDAVPLCQVTSVIDIGCGEGWLARRLSESGIVVTGIDATHALVDAATKNGGGHFQCLNYNELHSLAAICGAPFELAVCNFSLLGESSTETVLAQLAALLQPAGRLIIQTLHPAECNSELPYQDGWRQSSWDGFDSTFTDPAPWYFRTLSSWLTLLRHHGFSMQKISEPLLPSSKRPASIIFIATLTP